MGRSSDGGGSKRSREQGPLERRQDRYPNLGTASSANAARTHSLNAQECGPTILCTAIGADIAHRASAILGGSSTRSKSTSSRSPWFASPRPMTIGGRNEELFRATAGQSNAWPGHSCVSYQLRTHLEGVEKITGVSYPNLSAIEHDRVDVGVRRAVLLAAAFGIEPRQILFPHGYQRPEHQEAQRVRTRAKRMLEKKRHIAA